MGAGIKGHERPAERDPNETKGAGWNSTPNSSAWQRICFTLIWGWIQSSKVSLTIQGNISAQQTRENSVSCQEAFLIKSQNFKLTSAPKYLTPTENLAHFHVKALRC